MATYYIKRSDTDEVYALDATTDVSVQMSGTVTDFPIEDGSSVQDNYVNKNTTATFSGSISTTKSLVNKDNLSPVDYMDALKSMKKQKVLFDVYWRSDETPLVNCIFSTLTFKQDATRGYINALVNSISVSFTVQEIRLANLAELGVTASEKFTDKVAKTSVGDSSTEDIDGDKPLEGLDAKEERLKKEIKELTGAI